MLTAQALMRAPAPELSKRGNKKINLLTTSVIHNSDHNKEVLSHIQMHRLRLAMDKTIKAVNE